MKIDRLMAITIYLLNHGKTSAHKLANEFEVSSRTIMRDMEALERAGIPIVSTCGADGGYQILDTFVLDKQLANSEDYDFIFTALQGLASAYVNKNLKQTLGKINSLAAKNNVISVDFSVAHENQDTNELIRVLEDAIKHQRIVQFQYTNNENEKKLIQVEPVSVTFKWYNWYLIGYYEKYHDYCMFKLVRIEQLSVTDKPNSRQHSLSEALVNDRNTQKMIQVKLFGKSRIKAKCREYLNGEFTKEYDNGDFEFCFTVPEKETFWYGAILSFGSDVKILEPQSLVDRVLSTCRDILAEYEK